MTVFRYKDACSLKVTVIGLSSSGHPQVKWIDAFGNDCDDYVPASDLTLVRRAPVDLATCELPVEVVDEDGDAGKLLHRHDGWGWVKYHSPSFAFPANNVLPISELRPLDAPAPAPDQSTEVAEILAALEKVGVRLVGGMNGCELFAVLPEAGDIAAEIERLRVAGAEQTSIIHSAQAILASYLPPDGITAGCAINRLLGLLDSPGQREAQKAWDEALASTAPSASDQEALWGEMNRGEAPTCPPGHFMIGDRAVPEPMREAPLIGTRYWFASLPDAWAIRSSWSGCSTDLKRLADGLIHSTEAAARTHAEAIVAASKREG